jgi:hypothetical protein
MLYDDFEVGHQSTPSFSEMFYFDTQEEMNIVKEKLEAEILAMGDDNLSDYVQILAYNRSYACTEDPMERLREIVAYQFRHETPETLSRDSYW